MFFVSVFVIDLTEIGASPPILTHPIKTGFVIRLGFNFSLFKKIIDPASIKQLSHLYFNQKIFSPLIILAISK